MNEIDTEVVDTNDYKELYGKLRNTISSLRDVYKTQLAQTKDLIEIREEELKSLIIRKNKLEGAIESTEGLVNSILPNNNKKHGDIR